MRNMLTFSKQEATSICTGNHREYSPLLRFITINSGAKNAVKIMALDCKAFGYVFLEHSTYIYIC